MQNLSFKIRVLINFLRSNFRHWKTEVWDRDLDDLYCCNGHECGCMGVTIREVYRG